VEVTVVYRDGDDWRDVWFETSDGDTGYATCSHYRIVAREAGE
jgi:hypothetical protein